PPGLTPIPSGGTIQPRLTLTPVQLGGVGFDQNVEFELSHFYVAYRMSNAPASFSEFAVYEEANPINDMQVQNIGLNTSGLVSGQQIYQSVGGRNLSVVSTAASAGLQKEINRNVTTLVRNVTPCEAQVQLTFLSTIDSDCILVDEVNK